MNEDFLLNGPVRNLSRIFRFSSMPMHEPENVAEHTFWVGWYSMQIVHWYTNKPPTGFGETLKYPLVNVKILYELTFCHDLAECYTGDMIRPVKYSSEKFLEAYREMEEEGLNDLLAQLPTDTSLAVQRALEFKAENPESIEVRILKLADLLSVWGKLKEEANLGNRYAQEELNNSLDAYAEQFYDDPDLGPLFAEIASELRLVPQRLNRWPRGR